MSCEQPKSKSQKREHTRDKSKHETKKSVLKELLLGAPLNSRDRVEASKDNNNKANVKLNQWMCALRELIPKIYGVNEASNQATLEFEIFEQLPGTHDGLMCKRAALLYALMHERELGPALGRKDPLVRDMRNRVLPFICPRFLRGSCQTPDAFVVLSLVLSEMWAGERLGNWPEAGRTDT